MSKNMCMKDFSLGRMVVLFSLTMLALPVLAQETDPMTEGLIAFRESRFDDAARAFERAAESDPQNAEAHFLLARVYFETPLRDVKRAGKELDRALDIDPDNVQYLVARLEQLRVESTNFIVEKIREAKRVRLANHILKLDSTNAFAHEELGLLYIRDFWRYRNALAIPRLKFANPNYDQFIPETRTVDIEETLPTGAPAPVVGTGLPARLYPDFDQDEYMVDDRFDLNLLASQGVALQKLEERADRAYDRALVHLNRSLDSDPRRRSVYENLLRVHTLREDYSSSLNLLAKMFQYFPSDSFVWVNLGLAHYRSGNMSASAASFNKALALMPAEERGAFESVDLILPESEKKSYLADADGYASRFWTSKDPRYLTTYNERKLEHFSRIVCADLLYSSADTGQRGWESDRGRILIRYGIPKADVVWLASGSVNDRRVLSTALFGLEDVIDFSVDPVEESNRYNIWEYGDFRFVFEDPFNNGRFRFYSPPADAISNDRAGQAWLNDYEIRSKEIFRKRPDLFEYEPPGRRIDLPFLTSSFRGEDDRADVYVHFGVPVSSFDSSQDLIELTAHVGTFLINDTRDVVVERRKTLYGLKIAQVMNFDESSLWVATEKMSAPSGPHDVSVEFETASGGTVAVQRRAVVVPEFPEDRLSLSDVMLSYRVEDAEASHAAGGAEVVRNGLAMMPAPWSVFGREQPIYLYFEVYGLTQNPDSGTNFEVSAVLAPKDERKGLAGVVRGIFGGGDKGVSVTVPVSGSARDDYQYLILDASNQEPGVYTLRVRVKDNISGKSADRTQDLFLE